MSKWCTYSKLLFLVLFLADVACSQRKEKTSRVEELPYYEDASFTPRWIDPKAVASDFHQIPPFELLNQYGQLITEKDLNQKVTVVDFFFTTCPGICPKMTANLLLVQEAFMSDDKVQILSHSVMPNQDSETVLRNYAEAKGIQKQNWYLLTGERSKIYDLGRNHYFIEEDMGLQKDPEDFIHTENFILLDGDRRIRGIYNGLNKSSVRQLVADVERLLKS